MAFKKSSTSWIEKRGNITAYISRNYSATMTTYYLTVIKEVVCEGGMLEDKTLVCEKDFATLNEAKRYTRTIN